MIFPLNENEWLDSDNDGEGNNQDENDDNDHLTDFVEKLGNELNLLEFESFIFNDEMNHYLTMTDWDGVPDVLEIALKQSYENQI